MLCKLEQLHLPALQRRFCRANLYKRYHVSGSGVNFFYFLRAENISLQIVKLLITSHTIITNLPYAENISLQFCELAN